MSLIFILILNNLFGGDFVKEVLYIVMPVYNEEEVINASFDVINKKINILIKAKMIAKESKILVVDDGSNDDTFKILREIKNDNLIIVKLSRNCGHQNAMYAGLMEAKKYADMVITIDADLQDDIGVIDVMLDNYYNGNEIVYGVRNNRDNDTFFKRNSALIFYNLMKFLGVEIIINHADYRLMSKKSLEALEKYEESNLFLRGIIPQLGFKTSKVYYTRLERKAGTSKYNLKKMVTLALNGITSFSVKPIRLIISVGFILSFLSILYLIYVIIGYFTGDNYVNGWASTIAFICFFGSFQVLCIGIIGEYISKIYLETKRRPKYIIEEIIK